MEFKEMRRKQQEMSESECEKVLKESTSGVLALAGNNYPYAVPVSFVYDGRFIYIHSSKKGQKIEMIADNHLVSFCVIGQDTIQPQSFSTLYRSVVVFGKAEIVASEEEKKEALMKIALKYSPDDKTGAEKEAQASLQAVAIIRITIEHLTGKKAKALVERLN
jgi:nitroimidazol reductase NimA-like FMN-containing flavoprotein (pyridoxamine 5'-phosphate oxidase superfamily)